MTEKINTRYACTRRRKSRRSISFNIYIVEMKQNDNVGEWKKKQPREKKYSPLGHENAGKVKNNGTTRQLISQRYFERTQKRL